MRKTIYISLACILFSLICTGLFAQESASAASDTIVEYYGEVGCGHCDTFTEKLFPAAQKEAGVEVRLKVMDILSDEGYAECSRRLQELGYEFTIFPVLILGERAYLGNAAIEENLLPELKYYAKNGRFKPKKKQPGIIGNAGLSGLRIIPVILAGLIDGVNPCAFTTLLFFISLLSVRGKTKKSIALLGLLFTAGIFISYFFIGFGLFNILRAGSALSVIRLILRLAVSTATSVFLVLTIIDYVKIKRGASSDMVLQLPKGLKKRIHSSIRKSSLSPALLVSIFLSGIVIAVLELACTGQVYFPTIAYMVQTDVTLLGLGSLLLYNAAFVLPILAVLALIIFGLGQERLQSFFKRRLGFTKILLAAVFVCLTVSVWIF